MKSGIYKIVNNINSKCYIGSSIDTKRRLEDHFKLLRKNKHHNPHLQASYNKYGEENFTCSIIEYCDKDILLERELHHIIIYKSLDIKYGYNIGIPKINEVYSHVNSISVFGICIKTNKILREFKSISEAGRVLNAHKRTVSKIVNKDNKSYLGMRFISKDLYDPKKDYRKKYKNKSYTKKGRFQGYKVQVLDLNDNLILELPNSKEVAKYFNTSIKYIGKVTRGEKKTIQGHKLIMIK